MGDRDAASFRDPSGHVHHHDGRILRTVTSGAVPGYERVRDSGLLRTWIDAGRVVETREVPIPDLPLDDPPPRYLLEHARIPFVSYPYEWSFGALKAAALLHLDLQRDALDHDVELSDASAYNVQFIGARPVFIDVLSFRPYSEGSYWTGHRQFCHQCLNPLLLRALLGIPHNAWYRGAFEGIPTTELNALLPWTRKLSWNVLSQVTLPARVEARVIEQASTGRNVPLDMLLGWLTSLAPRGIVEFVPKTDPTIQRMLAAREDIFSEYTEQAFTTILSGLARIARSEVISATGRRLFLYDRQ